MAPFMDFFWIRTVFPLVIHWDGDGCGILNLNSCMSSWPGVLQFIMIVMYILQAFTPAVNGGFHGSPITAKLLLWFWFISRFMDIYPKLISYTPLKTMNLQWCKNLKGIFADLNRAVVWTVFISRISSFPNLFSRFLGIIPMTLTMITITVIFKFLT